MQKSLLSLTLSLCVAAPVWSVPDEAPSTTPRADAKTNVSVTIGSGANTFKTVPNWGGIPDKVNIGPTHGSVVVDKAGLVYVSTDGNEGIFVFNPDGSLVRKMAPEYSGLHAMCIRDESGEEFIYAAHLRTKQAVKLKLDGTAVLKLPYPPEADAYPEGKGFNPTAVAVAPDGSIFVADGYGLSWIHKYNDAAGKYVKTFGGRGEAPGKFKICHGIALDTRSGQPLLLVCDRENNRLQHFDLEGNFVSVVATGLRRPAAVSIQGENVAIAELGGRVTILDKTNKIAAVLGDNPDEKQRANFNVAPADWLPGVFTAPHGLSYDAAGNLYVQDWNKTGRVTKLIKATP